jgi:glycosyltransferase involved in cell wall biosynthesis
MISPTDRSWVKRVLFLVPHLDIFGGVLRFIELARVLKHMNVECVIGVLSAIGDSALNENGRFSDIKIMTVDDCLRSEWDVVVCGDYSSGLFLWLPFLKAKISCAYLLNGWSYRHFNIEQLKLCRPELVIANSSYVSVHYKELAPVIIPGGINLEVFYPRSDRRKAFNPYEVHIVVPVGRKKLRKRFVDGFKACLKLSKKRKVVMHTMCMGPLEDLSTGNLTHLHHRALSREGVADLYSRVDIALYPEEDAGWNNHAIEGMACGVPIVCTPAGTVDFAYDNKTALVVEARDIKGFVAALERLVESDVLRTEIASHGAEIAREFSWFRVGRDLLDTFESSHKAIAHHAAINAKLKRGILKALDGAH